MTDSRVEYAILSLVEHDVELAKLISYGPFDTTCCAPIQILDSGFFHEPYGTPRSLPKLPFPTLEGVPVLFGQPCTKRNSNTLFVYADLVASAYFLVTRYEEWVRPNVRDQHGRFPGRQSLPYRAGFIHRPIVNEYAALIRKWVHEMGLDLPEPKTQFGVLLTHDCDVISTPRGPFRAARALTSAALRRRSFRSGARVAAAASCIANDPVDNIEEVIALDSIVTADRHPSKASSIYYFISGGRTEFDGNYDIRSRTARRWIELARHSGAEIGLHASYHAGQNPALLVAERNTLEEVAGVPITKNRHHYLAWREPEHGHELAAAGIRWDTTLGYADVAGFRLGVCKPIPLFCPARRKLLGIEEHPLTIMDCTLSHARYMNLDQQRALEHCRRLADVVHAHRGVFVLLWHNDVLAMTHPHASYHRFVYARLLEYTTQLLNAPTPCK